MNSSKATPIPPVPQSERSGTGWRSLAGVSQWFLAAPGWLQVLAWLLLIVGLKHPDLFAPPVWDSAMGVFPPAVYLYQTGFDLLQLLREDGWWDGGPNVHSLSLLTWMIALLMTATDSAPVTFATLHALTFLAFAWALHLFTRTLNASGIAPYTTLAAAWFLLLMPVVLVQVGYMYTEIFVLVCSVAAWHGWQRDRVLTALAFGVVGLAFKLTGIAILLAMMAAIVLSERRRETRRVVVLLLIPAIVYAHLALPGWLGAVSEQTGAWRVSSLLDDALVTLFRVPDLALLIGSSLAASAAYLLHLRSTSGSWRFVSDSTAQNSGRLLCLGTLLVFVAGVLYQLNQGFLFLPRYLVPAVPFAIAAVLYYARLVDRQRAAFVLLILGAAFSAVNTNGGLYPEHYRRFSLVERSHAYREFNRLQQELAAEIERGFGGVPIYLTREMWYMVSDPMMGYVADKIPNTRPIFRADYRDVEVEDFPDEFVLVMSNAGHGGRRMSDIVDAALSSALYEVSGKAFAHSGFTAVIYRLRRRRA